MTTKISLIISFCFLFLFSCSKKKDAPAPSTQVQSKDTTKVNGEYYIKYTLDGKEYEHRDGLDGFQSESTTINSSGNNSSTNHYLGGIIRVQDKQLLRLTVGRQEVECSEPNDLNLFPNIFKEGKENIKYYDFFQNKGPYYYLKFQTAQIGGENGNTFQTFYPKESDNSMINITSVNNVGTVERTIYGTDYKNLGMAVKGSISNIKLYEHDMNFIQNGKVMELKNIEFNLLFTSVDTPK